MPIIADTALIYGYSLPATRFTGSSYYRARPGFPSVSQNQNGVAVGFLPETAGSITHISFCLGGITTAFSNLDVGIMSATLFGSLGSTVATPSNTFITSETVSMSNPGWNDVTLTTPYTASMGNMFFIAAKMTASTTGDAYFLVKDTQGSNTNNNTVHRRPISYYRTSTNTWAGTSNTVVPAHGVAYKIGNQWYGAGIHVSSLCILDAVNDTNEYGFSFQLAANHPDIRVKAYKTAIHHYNIGAQESYKIYNSSGSLLYTFNTSNTSLINPTYAAYVFNTSGQEVWLSGGQKYYFLCGLTSTPVNSTALQSYISYCDPDKSTMAGGIAWTACYAQKVNGIISEDTRRYCEFQIIVDKIRY